MSRRRAAASTVIVPAILPLDGCVITICGKFKDHTHASVTDLAKTLGGGVSKNITQNTTHVVCSESDYTANSAKVLAAKGLNLPIVSLEWLVESQKQKKLLSVDDYTWDRSQSLPSSQDLNTNKRSACETGNDTDGPKSKKTKTEDDNVDADADVDAEAKSAKVKHEELLDQQLQKEKEKEDKKVAVGQFIKKKGASVPLDVHYPIAFSQYTVYTEPESGLIFDASLNQTHATKNANKFYILQIWVSPDSQDFKTWMRWGRVGEAGQSNVAGNGSLDDAMKCFQKKFREKSGLAWEKRANDPKPGKYAFVEKSYNPDDDDDDDAAAEDQGKGIKKEQKDIKPQECTLEPSIKSLMELIFNQQYFNATMSSLNYDANKLPLGKLSKGTILRGFQQLKDLAALLDDHSLASSRWNMPLPRATEHLSNLYYSIIPHAFGRRNPPIIQSTAMLKQEIDLLESLSDMKEAQNILKGLKNDDDHMLDKQFRGLGLDEMTVLERSSQEFKSLEQYLNGSVGQTHHVRYRVQDIFRIERQGEKDRFDEYVKASKIGANRRLLWHGSRVTNYGGILSQGLRIAPPEAPVSGYMFGKGIYLADMSSKSAGYCCSHISGGQGLLLLCEAKLGDPIQELFRANGDAGVDALAKSMESTLGLGRTAPQKWKDAGEVHSSLKGVQMPDMSVPPGLLYAQSPYLHYNEYICYDMAQVKLRYLFRVNM